MPSHADIEISKIKKAYDMSSDEEELIEELEVSTKYPSTFPGISPGVDDVIKDVCKPVSDGEIVITDIKKQSYKCGYCLRDCKTAENKRIHEVECEVKKEIKSRFYDKKPMPVPEPEAGQLWQVQLLNELLAELLETKFRFVDTDDDISAEEKYLNIMKRDKKTRNKMTDHLYESIQTFMEELRLTEK